MGRKSVLFQPAGLWRQVVHSTLWMVWQRQPEQGGKDRWSCIGANNLLQRHYRQDFIHFPPGALQQCHCHQPHQGKWRSQLTLRRLTSAPSILSTVGLGRERLWCRNPEKVSLSTRKSWNFKPAGEIVFYFHFIRNSKNKWIKSTMEQTIIILTALL